jgi:hypothetical protein
MDNVIIDVHKDIFLGSTGGARRKKKLAVFIAYRMNDPSSREMRASLERSIREIDSEVAVLDGKVPHGIPWADEVRRRIERSQMLVIDVTGPSREVMFELGFARNKPFIPVVHLQDDRDQLPAWLTAFQISAYEETGLPRLAQDVVTGVRTGFPEAVTYRRPSPVPAMVVWLQSRSSTRFSDSYERFENLARQYSLRVDRVDPGDLPSYDDLRRYLRAWIVVSCLDGGPADHAGHFFLGDVVGRQHAGTGRGQGQWLQRHGVALVPDSRDIPLLIADSVRRVSGRILTPLTTENILRESGPLFVTYRRWLRRDEEDG